MSQGNLEEREEFVISGGVPSPRPSAAAAAAEPGSAGAAPAGAPPPPPPPVLVNFDRVRRVGAAVEVVRAAQTVPYPFTDLHQVAQLSERRRLSSQVPFLESRCGAALTAPTSPLSRVPTFGHIDSTAQLPAPLSVLFHQRLPLPISFS